MFWHILASRWTLPSHDHHHNHHHFNHDENHLGGPYPDRQSWVLNDQVKTWRKQKLFDILYSLSSDWWLLQRQKQIFAMFFLTTTKRQKSTIYISYHQVARGFRHTDVRHSLQDCRWRTDLRLWSDRHICLFASLDICIFPYLYIFIFGHLYICTFYFSLSTEHLFLQ